MSENTLTICLSDRAVSLGGSLRPEQNLAQQNVTLVDNNNTYFYGSLFFIHPIQS